MLSFRQKVLLANIGVVILFFALLFPFATRSAKRVTTNAMQNRAEELISRMSVAKSKEEMIRRLRDQKHLLFFRVVIVDQERFILYDSHKISVIGSSDVRPLNTPEIEEAFKRGQGSWEGFSPLLGMQFVYFARTFTFQGDTYILRLAAPEKYVGNLTRDFELSFLFLGSGMIILFAILSIAAMEYITGPVDEIIGAIKPYQEGIHASPPKISLKGIAPQDDFGRLATTLNSLAERSKHHIDFLTQEKNEREAILDALTEGVIAVDKDLKIRFANGAALSMTKKNAESILHTHIDSLELPEASELIVRSVQAGNVLSESVVYQRDRTIYLDLVAAPLKKGEAILVIQDTSQEKRLIEMRKDFIANASHELKTPITIIRGFAETLHDNPELPLTVMTDVTAKIVRNCERMTALIKDLLTLSDTENLPATKIEPCSLNSIINESVAEVQAIYPTADIQIDADEGIIVEGNQDFLQMAINNLVNNAAKYSPEPAEVRISLKQIANSAQITISDQGMGIPKEDLDSIWLRFYRVDKSHSQKVGGTGLGLSIVKTIVDKHFGTIDVQSQLGKGTTFTLKLPLVRS